MVVFGITGGILGMVVGGKMDSPNHPEGEPTEILNKSIVTGGIIGAIIGSTIGYLIGKRNYKSIETDEGDLKKSKSFSMKRRIQ